MEWWKQELIRLGYSKSWLDNIALPLTKNLPNDAAYKKLAASWSRQYELGTLFKHHELRESAENVDIQKLRSEWKTGTENRCKLTAKSINTRINKSDNISENEKQASILINAPLMKRRSKMNQWRIFCVLVQYRPKGYSDFNSQNKDDNSGKSYEKYMKPYIS